MEFNLIGLAAGITTVLGVWMGHVLMRKLEYRSTSLILLSVCFALIGLFLEIGSFLSDSVLVSADLAILGITALWDVVEIFRQQKRVIKGRAPANTANRGTRASLNNTQMRPRLTCSNVTRWVVCA